MAKASCGPCRQRTGKKVGMAPVLEAQPGTSVHSSWLIGFIIFKCYPFISSLWYSMLNFNLFKEGTGLYRSGKLRVHSDHEKVHIRLYGHL